MDWVLFDCDGVLMDSEAVVLGVLEERFRSVLGDPPDLDRVLPGLLGMPVEGIADSLAERYETAFAADWVANLHHDVTRALRDLAGPIPDVAWALERIDLPKAVVSNSALANVHAALNRTGLIEHFGDRVFAAEQVARPKPAPDVYQHAAATLGTEPARCLVVEDSRSGVTAAVAAGTRVIGFTGGGHIQRGHDETQRAIGAVTSIASMRDLPDTVRRLLSP